MNDGDRADLAHWVALAVRAVGPIGGRDYTSWLAEVDRVAIDLWLRSSTEGVLARQAAELSGCTAVEGVLVAASVDEPSGRGHLVVRVRDADAAAPEERTISTEPTTLPQGRQLLAQATALTGHWVRLLVQDTSDGQLARHLSDEGAAEEPVPAATSDEAAPGDEAALGDDAGQAAAEPTTAPATSAASAAAVPSAGPDAAVRDGNPQAPAPAPLVSAGTTWEEGSVVIWRNINRAWDKGYRTSCLLAIRDQARVDASGHLVNLEELLAMAQQTPDPESPAGRDVVARYPV